MYAKKTKNKKMYYRNPKAYTKNMLKVSEVMYVFDVSRPTIHNWIDKGILHAYRNGERAMILIPKDEVIKLYEGGVCHE